MTWTFWSVPGVGWRSGAFLPAKLCESGHSLSLGSSHLETGMGKPSALSLSEVSATLQYCSPSAALCSPAFVHRPMFFLPSPCPLPLCQSKTGKFCSSFDLLLLYPTPLGSIAQSCLSYIAQGRPQFHVLKSNLFSLSVLLGLVHNLMHAR